MNKLFTAVGTPAHGRPTVAGPTGRQGPSGRSPAVGTYEGWVTSYGVCGHLLDSLFACDHSATLMKPEQAHFGRLYVRMFFRKASPQTEGRRYAHLRIKLPPVFCIFTLSYILEQHSTSPACPKPNADISSVFRKRWRNFGDTHFMSSYQYLALSSRSLC